MTDMRHKILFWLMLVLCLIASKVVIAQPEANPDQLPDDAQIKAWVAPDIDIVATQQVNLFIEVTTPRWFTGGTRISNLEIDDVVVLRRDQFSVNSTRRIGEQTWSVQLWTMALYPQREGTYQIPAIDVYISAANNQGIATAKRLVTKPISFNASVPPKIAEELADVEYPWLATTWLQISERYNKASNNLTIGDSVQRIIEIKSENIAAMMLPTLQFSSQQGLAAYQKPPKIEDKVNRGDYLASRIDSISYVIEEPGTYTLPSLDFYWWDLTTQSLQRETLPARLISTDDVTAQISDINTPTAQVDSGASVGKRVLSGFMLLILASLAWWLISRRRECKKSININKNKELKKKFKVLCRVRNYHQAAEVLYKWVNLRISESGIAVNEHSLRRWLSASNKPAAIKSFDGLMSAAHSQSNSSIESLASLESLPEEIEMIIDAMQAQFLSHQPFELRLN